MLITKPKFAHHFKFCPVATSLADLTGGRILLSIFAPIIPEQILARFDRAYNIHPGPITHPGRDPHHWAIYEGDRWFGVTLHMMTERVDDGDVLRTEPFRIETSDPAELRDQANERAIAMMNQYGPALLRGEYELPPMAEEWCGVKRSRKDTIREAEQSMHPAFSGFLPLHDDINA